MRPGDPRPALSLFAFGFVDLLYPPKCLVCTALSETPVCAQCASDFIPFPTPSCAICGGCGDDPSFLDRETMLCPECRQNGPRHFRSARSAGVFDGALRSAIHALKYDGRCGLGVFLGVWVARSCSSQLRQMRPDVVVPVPLHWVRRRTRGFNQSDLIGQGIAQTMGWECRTDVLARVRWTRPQVLLDAEHRAANVRNAFAVRRPEAVRGRSVVLVDDVLTTLHTADECARVLVGAGAASVDVVAVAR